MELNYLAVFVAGLVAFALGGFWYSPLLFGKRWMKLMKISEGEMEKENQKGMAARYAGGFLTALFMAWVFAYVLEYVIFWYGNRTGSANEIVLGLQTAWWVWLGFVATKSFGHVLWEKQPLKLWVLNSGYDLAALVVIGVILGTWR